MASTDEVEETSHASTLSLATVGGDLVPVLCCWGAASLPGLAEFVIFRRNETLR